MSWLVEEILTGMQRLKVYRFANSPSTDEELTLNARAWVDALVEARPWEMDRDREAIRDGFDALARREPRELGQPVFWPAPGELLAAIPKGRQHSAPYHQVFAPAPKYALEWNRDPRNRSTIAKAHAIVATRALGLDPPAWAVAADGEQGTLDQLVASVEAEQARRAEAMRRDHAAQPKERAA